MRRRPVTIVQSAIFALLAMNAWFEAGSALFLGAEDPTALVLLQIAIGAAGAAAAWGIWHQVAWAWIAAIAYGAVTACMLLALPSLLELPAEARAGIWGGAAGVMLFAVLCAAWLRYDAKRRAG